uniref:20S proteasome A and B subunits n=2 Tax=Candidatus Bipolaricaulota TaxID=67810 RepID=H5SEU3_9BACT|nr:20S proteasome A and B subunits [uncultured Acetothermia bacterium]BAL58335.1 20S proteasome A and B subunits [Candidatus Acetothermum autotrophicum]
MAFTPYDWQQTLRQKADYVEDRLREGSPVVGLSCHEGILLVTVRRAQQQKIFEIYDRLAFAGLGNQSDLETIRQIAVDFAHAEGFARSPQDVSIQRVVGVALSPAMKRSFSDPLRLPLVVRGLFAQLGDAPEGDLFYLLNYDGEFSRAHRWGVAAGTEGAREAMERVLTVFAKKTPKRDAALEKALEAWAIGRRAALAAGESEWRAVLAEALESGTLEAALVERASRRERRFRFLSPDELKPFVPE